MSDILAAVLVATVAFMLILASIEDLSTRTVRNVHWAAIGVFGVIVNLFAFAEEDAFFGLAVSVMSATILYGILNGSDRFENERILILGTVIAMTVVSCVLVPSSDARCATLSIPAFAGIFMLMYYTGLLRGGADAKCLISLTVAFPAYPVFYKFPFIKIVDNISSTVFPFSLAILFHALLITLSLSIPLFLMNLKRRDIGKHMFTGYVTDIETGKNSHVWPMYDFRDGELTRIPLQDNAEDIYERLKIHSEKKIWVTPMIPFIIPITVSYILTVIIGNPMFLIL